MTEIDAYLETENLTEGRTELYEMSERSSVDIDVPFDLWLAEQLLDYEQSDADILS